MYAKKVKSTHEHDNVDLGKPLTEASDIGEDLDVVPAVTVYLRPNLCYQGTQSQGSIVFRRAWVTQRKDIDQG